MTQKFRAWDKASHAWRHDIYIGLDGLAKDLSRTGEEPFELPLDDVIIMQSTGLFDINGKEIFEGDVFTCLDDDNNPIYENIVVKFGQHTNMDTVFEREPVYIGLYIEGQRGTATFDVDRMYNDCEGRLTIIGNIYENPELVEG
ncbi:phage protein [Streptococcus suis]|uniref:Phage protein n=1 Tax=Streptococcus suis TaxID=1307 RepID=A0A0Z8G1K1_STRSU|nr:YopX family protein [Streptococcus suis]NQH39944.1 hypothetical protein [Streptococcus suis]CYU90401.1 phage protein [Streptococcus suis]